MSTVVKPTDWDAEDNMWEPTPSGGGSGLPPYTSADKGKVLTIGEGEGSVPTVEPKWEAAGGGIFKLSSDMSTGALDKNYTEIKAAITGGLLPVMFADGSVSIPIVAAVSENNAFNVYGISVRQGALFLIKWSASLPNGPLTPAP